MKKLICMVLVGVMSVGALAGFKMESQSLGLEKVENARQIGGYQTADGRHVREDVLLRSGKLSGATEEDLKILTEKYNLKQVVDFRTSGEVSSEPDPDIEGVTNTNVRVLDESSDTGKSAANAMTGIYQDDPAAAMISMVENGMVDEDMYVDVAMDEHAQEAYRQFFQILLENEDGAVLWHCTGGKDRAGTAAALLLSALGADRETILDDFALTNDFNAAKIEYMADEAAKKTDDPAVIEGVRTLTGVDRAFMEKMLDAIDEKYGSMDLYLKEAVGLTEEDIKNLQDKYLV